jgi:sugar lactone lactonase YvrE
MRTRSWILGVWFLGVVHGSHAAAEDPPKFVLKWGTGGAGDGQFDTPADVVVDSSGHVYVSDYLNHRIQKFTSEGMFISKWGSFGAGEGQLSLPGGLAIDSQHVLYVAEYGNKRVQKFTLEGVPLGYLVVWDFQSVVDVAVDGDDMLYVASPDGHRIYKFASNGSVLTSWGTQGPGEGEFELASGIAVDPAGFVYVSDSINNCIQKFTDEGTYLQRWSPPELNEPRLVTVDENGSIYAPSTAPRIFKLSAGGVVISSWGERGSGDGQFNNPAGIAVVGLTDVYVVDSHNNRIQKFSYPVSVNKVIWGEVKKLFR